MLKYGSKGHQDISLPVFLWTWGHESNTFNNVTQCGLLYPHRCKLNICFNLNYCSNNSYKKVPTLAQGNSDGHFFFCSLPTIYRSIKTIADSLTDHDSNRQSLALRGWFFYPHFCEISTIPSWAFDDIIFPSIRGSPLVLCGLGFSKGPVNILQWMSERARSSIKAGAQQAQRSLLQRSLYRCLSDHGRWGGKNGELCCHFWNEMTEAWWGYFRKIFEGDRRRDSDRLYTSF